MPDDDIGFVTRVYPGVKENGSIFSHPNPWAWAAECVLGRGDIAMKYYDALCPYYQNDKIEIRESEPYSYCQFVMGKDHTAFGRAVRKWRGAEFEIEVKNPEGVMKGVKEIWLDGKKAECIPVQEEGTKHSVIVVMGKTA